MRTKIIFILPLVALLSGCKGKTNEEPQVVVEKTPVVAVAKASKATVDYINSYSSTVQAFVVNNIVSQTAGRIKDLKVEIGDFVKKGDILAQMDEAQLDQASLKLANDALELERIKTLYEQGGISQSDYQALELAHNVSKRSHANLLENTTLCSPIDGVITARNYDKGDMYAMQTPIYTVQQISPVKLLVAISESDYSKVNKGDEVTITVDAVPGKTFYGKVVRIYPVIDPSTHTFTAEVNVENKYKTLRPGMFARVKVDMGSQTNIVVPDQAVIKQQGSGDRGIFVLKGDNTVELRLVKVGLHFDNKYEILSGIKEGETIVVKGGSTLRAGTKVDVQ